MRRKIDFPLLESWDDVNLTLRRLGQIERDMNLIRDAMKEQIETAKSNAEEELNPLEMDHKRLSAALEQFAIHHKEEFEKAPRSRKLMFGKIGFHKTPGKFKPLRKWNWKQVLEKLQELGKKQFIRVKEEVDKEALEKAYKEQQISDDSLEIYGLKWHTDDEFYFELFEEEIPVRRPGTGRPE